MSVEAVSNTHWKTLATILMLYLLTYSALIEIRPFHSCSSLLSANGHFAFTTFILIFFHFFSKTKHDFNKHNEEKRNARDKIKFIQSFILLSHIKNGFPFASIGNRHSTINSDYCNFNVYRTTKKSINETWFNFIEMFQIRINSNLMIETNQII